ncbi:MAG: SDR family NAD(P)-dependent oxidoreductase [Alphaproteobacteria bacterium]|nr:SDR family NAD(P)-dependent oxidoreductase [Alphaproteobacteria bacterium]
MAKNVYSGKTVWIIGASSGIGAALARELSDRGARIILSARRENTLEEVLGTLCGEGHLVYPLDVRDVYAVQSIIADFQDKNIAVDSVIFMPALYGQHSSKGHDIDLIHQMIAVNLTGAFNLVHYLGPFFKKQGYGQIVLCASIAGYRGLPMGQPYCATKAGLASYAESLKLDLKKDNIDVKLISPGFVRTPLTDKNDFPMPFMIEAEDAAKAIADGLNQKGFEIHFPKHMTILAKILRVMPGFCYFWVMGIILKKITDK